MGLTVHYRQSRARLLGRQEMGQNAYDGVCDDMLVDWGCERELYAGTRGEYRYEYRRVSFGSSEKAG
jgi:hypothetical protein